MNNHPACTVVISTLDRPEPMRLTLESTVNQTLPPERVIVVDASRSATTRDVCNEFAGRLHIEWMHSELASAARQRNQGAAGVQTPLIAFMDDDVILPPDIFEKLRKPFLKQEESLPVVGVAGRIQGLEHKTPRGLLRAYYWLQAGFDDPHYGARVFGPAINTLPCYEAATSELIRSDWLNSTCVVYENAAFQQEKFPDFPAYSFMEDVHLSLRMANHGALYFHATAEYEHRSQSSAFKRDHLALARSRIANQRCVARDILGLQGATFHSKFLLHKLFITATLLRSRRPGSLSEILGTWTG